MKKTLAILLSVAMVLTMMVGMFTFNVSAAEEKPYAEQQAETLWAEANKAESVKVDSVELNNGDTKNLATAKPETFVSGTASFNDGFLQLNNVVLQEGKTRIGIRALGGLKVDFTGADLYAAICSEGQKIEDVAHANLPEKSHLIVTSSDGHALLSNGGNALRTNKGALVTYGPMGLDVRETNNGWDGVCTANYTAESATYPMILGNTGGTYVSVNGAGGTVSCNTGDLIFCGTGDFTVVNENDTASGVAIRASHNNGSIIIRDSVNLTVRTVGGNGIYNTGSQSVGNTAIDISTTGTVTVAQSAVVVSSWQSGAISAGQGSVKISSKVLMNAAIGTYTSGCFCAFNLQNSGKDTAGGLFLSGNAEVAVNIKNEKTFTKGVRMVGTWINYGILDVSDNAKFTVRYQHDAKIQSNFSAITIKIGRMNVSDNAKVYLHGINNGPSVVGSSSSSVIANAKAIEIQRGDDTNTTEVSLRAAFGDNAGLHVSGNGQLEVNTVGDPVNYGDHSTLRGGSHFTGGIVSFKDRDGSGKYIFPQDLNQQNDNRYNVISNIQYAGPVTINVTQKVTPSDTSYYNQYNKRSGEVDEYLYFANGASYVPYDGIAENAAFFGELSTIHNDFAIAVKNRPTGKVFDSVNVTLNEDIALNYYVNYTGTGTPTMTFKVHGETIENVTGEKKDDQWVFKCTGIAPQCVADTVTAILYDGNGVEVETKEYSVLQNLNGLKSANLKETYGCSDAEVAATKNVVADLLKYAGAAQAYKEHVGEDVGEGITGSTFEAPASVAGVMNNMNGKEFTFDKATVYFDGQNKLAFQFTTEIENVTFKVNGVEAGEVINGNVFLTNGVKASQFADEIIVIAYEGETELAKVRYSVNSYVAAKHNDGKIGELAQRTYCYGVSALAFANAQ